MRADNETAPVRGKLLPTRRGAALLKQLPAQRRRINEMKDPNSHRVASKSLLEGLTTLSADGVARAPSRPSTALVLHFPQVHGSLEVPLSLRLGATGAGKADVTVRLVDFGMGSQARGTCCQSPPLHHPSNGISPATVNTPSSQSSIEPFAHGDEPSSSRTTTAQRLATVGGLLLAYVMFPDQLGPAIQHMAMPGAVLASTSALRREAMLRLPRRAVQHAHSVIEGQPLLSAAYSVGVFAGSSFVRVSGKPLEAAWRAAHKRAAQRLSPFLGDLPASPPLKPAADFLGRLSICAGVAVDGLALCGFAPASGSGRLLNWQGGRPDGGRTVSLAASLQQVKKVAGGNTGAAGAAASAASKQVLAPLPGLPGLSQTRTLPLQPSLRRQAAAGATSAPTAQAPVLPASGAAAADDSLAGDGAGSAGASPGAAGVPGVAAHAGKGAAPPHPQDGAAYLSIVRSEAEAPQQASALRPVQEMGSADEPLPTSSPSAAPTSPARWPLPRQQGQQGGSAAHHGHSTSSPVHVGGGSGQNGSRSLARHEPRSSLAPDDSGPFILSPQTEASPPASAAASPSSSAVASPDAVVHLESVDLSSALSASKLLLAAGPASSELGIPMPPPTDAVSAASVSGAAWRLLNLGLPRPDKQPAGQILAAAESLPPPAVGPAQSPISEAAHTSSPEAHALAVGHTPCVGCDPAAPEAGRQLSTPSGLQAGPTGGEAGPKRTAASLPAPPKRQRLEAPWGMAASFSGSLSYKGIPRPFLTSLRPNGPVTDPQALGAHAEAMAVPLQPPPRVDGKQQQEHKQRRAALLPEALPDPQKQKQQQQRPQPSAFQAASAYPLLAPPRTCLEKLPATASVGKGAAVVAAAPPLPLYGRGDHDGEEAEAQPLGNDERVQMAARGAYLLLAFAPFLTLGVLLIYLASWLGGLQERKRQQRKRKQQQQLANTAFASPAHTLTLCATAAPPPLLSGTDSPAAQAMVVVAAAAGGTAGQQVARSGWLDSMPVTLRTWAWRLLLNGCRCSGAAFIKWGQWAASRGDMFPSDFRDVMSSLHDDAPMHSTDFSIQAVETAFGCSIAELFLSFDEKALASGSIAQVHRAVMMVDGSPSEVIVKVRHPHVATRIARDFRILKPLAAAASQYRMLKGLSLKESVSQFSATMTAQADLRVEAAHLARFQANFAGVGAQVTTPRLVPGFATENVLIETFEPGQSVAQYMRTPGPMNTQIVALGVDTYLKMLLKDNFVHTDLHPGNIMVRMLDADNNVLSRDAAAKAIAASELNPGKPGEPPSVRAQLILLDFGLAEELTPRVRQHFISFLNHICSGNGASAARHLLRWARKQQCPDPAAFTADMARLFSASCNIHSPTGIDLDGVMKSVLQLARRHEVSIDSGYASLVLAVCVIVGFATALDPAVNLLDAAAPCLLTYSLTGRVIGRLYS